jgi:hypothetical protein
MKTGGKEKSPYPPAKIKGLTLYQTYAFNMCWVTYFDTLQHPNQNLLHP